MARHIRLLVILWQFAALPALCQSGVLEHLCPEDANSACSHEMGCESDPCSDSDVMLGKPSARDEAWVDHAAVTPSPWFHTFASIAPPTRIATPHSAREGLRAPHRAFPLLI